MMIKRYLWMLFFLFSLCLVPQTKAAAASITEGARRFKLDNGLDVILKEDHSAPVASIQVWVKAGSANESEEEAGITHLIEHMIFKGTPSRKTGEIARSIESSGGEINAYTTFDRTVYYVEIDCNSFDTALDVLLDAVQHSIFDPTELAREKEVVLEEYRRSMDLPETRLSWAMLDLCYKKHPYKRPIIGYESSIKSITREDILGYIDKWYTADNMALVAVGDFDSDDALNKVRYHVRDFPKRKGQNPSRTIEPEQADPRILFLKTDVQQIYLDISWHIPSLTHPHTPALDLLEIILGQGKSSRLYTKLKMERNLVRSIDAGAYPMADPGLFSVESTLNSENIKSAIETIAGEITRITREPVAETELSKAKKIAESEYLSEMEEMKGQARTLAFFETMMGDMNKADEYLEQLKALSSMDIMNVAGLYLRPNNLSIGVMSPEGSNIDISEDQIMEIFHQKYINNMGLNDQSIKEGDKENSKMTLPNGMRVIIKENHRLPLVSIRAVFLGGTRLERPECSGISSFVSKILTRGTNRMSASEIASTVESWAGEIEGFSGRNSFGISAKFLSKDLYQGLELLADLIINSSFPEDEIAKVREDILADINAKKDSPMPQLIDLFYSTLYRNHPYGQPDTGTVESINTIERSDLIKWYKSLALSSNLVLCVAGDVYKDEFMGKIEELLKGLDSSTFYQPEILPEPPLQGVREVHLERPGKQTHIMIGYLGPDLKSPDNAVITIIDAALSGQGGRLFMELRDKQSLAYSVSSFTRPGLETGMFGVYLACEPGKLSTAKEGIFKELEKVKEEGLSDQELEDAKRYLIGTEAIEYQTNGSQALRMALDEIYGLGYGHQQEFIREIRGVTSEDIKRVAKKFFIPNGYTIATVGPSQ
jgi:zinc protease